MRQFLPDAQSENDAPTMTGRAYAAMRMALMSGYLRPGERLTMRSLAEELGMSVTPVREAIQQLISEHVLAMPGPKTVIVPRIDAARYSEIILIRRALECLAAVQAAPHHDASMLAQLRQVNAQHKKAIEADSVGDVLARNKEFHFLIYRASGLPSLVDLIENQWVRVGPTLTFLFPRYMRSLAGNQCHDQMIDAIETGDMPALKAALSADLMTAHRELLKILAPVA